MKEYDKSIFDIHCSLPVLQAGIFDISPNKCYPGILTLFAIILCIIYSCNPAKKIQTVIARKDSVNVAETIPSDQARKDSMRFISTTLKKINDNRIKFTTFSAKVEMDYEDGEGKKYDVNAHVRIYSDSVIWISITAILGIEGLRIYITKDSVKLLDKQNKIYTARNISFLKDLTGLPLQLNTLQDLLVGNPVFLDPNILGYDKSENTITLQSKGALFKNLFTVTSKDYLVQNSKLDDMDPARNRTCYLFYSDYEDKKGVNFPTKRTIQISEKKKLNIKLDFKQYDFNEKLTFPFTVPKNYEQN